jgi:hypothetical protein
MSTLGLVLTTTLFIISSSILIYTSYSNAVALEAANDYIEYANGYIAFLEENNK